MEGNLNSATPAASAGSLFKPTGTGKEEMKMPASLFPAAFFRRCPAKARLLN